jgi:hypothetical protein
LRTPTGSAALGPMLDDLGTLNNGLGSIRNLELLLKSIKVGQKGLFAAVSAVHADCGPMIASAGRLSDSLMGVGADPQCARCLSDLLRASLTSLEEVLAVAVRSGRLSVAQRLKLEHDLSRSGNDLGAALSLVGLMDRASRPRPIELTPAGLVHAAHAERCEQKGVSAVLSVPAGLSEKGLQVDLDAAKLLLALGVALVMEGSSPRAAALVSFALPPGGEALTTITVGSGTPPGLVRMAAARLVPPSLLCAQAASSGMGGRFEYSAEPRRVCIYWPSL